MRRLPSYLALVALLVASFACNKPRVIPKDDLVAIFEQMYIADQWIRDAPYRQRLADTSYVYRPILQRFGYSEEDLRTTITFYTDRPSEFALIYDKVANNLRDRKKAVEAIEREKYVRDSTKSALMSLPFRRADFIRWPELDTLYRIRIIVDSLGTWKLVAASDTTAVSDRPLSLMEYTLHHPVKFNLDERPMPVPDEESFREGELEDDLSEDEPFFR